MTCSLSGHRVGSVCVAVALAAAPSASALAASASASLTGISLSVVDLDTTDGIDAAFAILAGGRLQNSGVAVTNRATTAEDHLQFELPGLTVPFAALSGSVSVPGAQAHAALTSNGASVSGSTSTADTVFYANLEPNFPGLVGLTVTPHTRLIIDAGYVLTAEAFDACGALFCDQSYSTVAISVGGDRFDSRLETASAMAQAGGGVVASGPKSGTFHMELDYYWDFAPEVELGFIARVEGLGGFGTSAPVPEPDSQALVLLGLGALGIASRYRRSR